jgi:hypothetical protein
MNRHIVVAFRMPASAMSAGSGVGYLPRARSLCARGEALGGRLVAFSAALLAMAWDTDSIEEAILLATSILEDARPEAGAGSKETAWAVGVAEGELEPLSPDGARMQLAWGQALLLAATLARVARGGEVLVDGEVRALRAGQLTLQGARTATDSGLQVRGWKLDLERPWKRGPAEEVPEVKTGEVAILDRAAIRADDPPSVGAAPDPASITVEVSAPEFDTQELSTAEVLEIVEASASLPGLSITPRPPSSVQPAPAKPDPRRQRGGRLAHRVRRLAAGDKSTDAMEAIAELRRERARAEDGGTPSSRCQAALALAMTLAIAGRAEDALLEALDALARAREASDPKAIDACTALLAKLYSSAGRPSEASALLRGA